VGRPLPQIPGRGVEQEKKRLKKVILPAVLLILSSGRRIFSRAGHVAVLVTSGWQYTLCSLWLFPMFLLFSKDRLNFFTVYRLGVFCLNFLVQLSAGPALPGGPHISRSRLWSQHSLRCARPMGPSSWSSASNHPTSIFPVAGCRNDGPCTRVLPRPFPSARYHRVYPQRLAQGGRCGHRRP